MSVYMYHDDELGRYGFPDGHPFGPDRQDRFYAEAERQGLIDKVKVKPALQASRAELERFHTPDYVAQVIAASKVGRGYLDYGDTPAFPGVYEAAAHVVGSALDGLKNLMAGECRRTFQAIGGLHHARRERAAGFCVFNDLGVVIETLRSHYKIQRIAYVDIDVHHGDGVYYPFESDPDVIFADLHEDGRFLYPGTGRADEIGKGSAQGTKLNIPMLPGSGDGEFHAAWEKAEAFVTRFKPQFILLQCGADSIEGDPLAHLQYSTAAHAHAAKRLCQLADEVSEGRLMVFGGGGYDRTNLAKAWSAVLKELIASMA